MQLSPVLNRSVTQFLNGLYDSPNPTLPDVEFTRLFFRNSLRSEGSIIDTNHTRGVVVVLPDVVLIVSIVSLSIRTKEQRKRE